MKNHRLTTFGLIAITLLILGGVFFWLRNSYNNPIASNEKSITDSTYTVGSYPYKDPCRLLTELKAEQYFSGVFGSESVVLSDRLIRSMTTQDLATPDNEPSSLSCTYQSRAKDPQQYVSIIIDYYPTPATQQKQWGRLLLVNYSQRTTNTALLTSIQQSKDTASSALVSASERVLQANIEAATKIEGLLSDSSNGSDTAERFAQKASEIYQGTLYNTSGNTLHLLRDGVILTLSGEKNGKPLLDRATYDSLADYIIALGNAAEALSEIQKNYDDNNLPATQMSTIRNGQTKIGSSTIVNPCLLFNENNLKSLGGSELRVDPRLLLTSVAKDTTKTTTSSEGYPVFPTNSCSFSWTEGHNRDEAFSGAISIDYAPSQELLQKRYRVFSEGQKQISISESVKGAYHKETGLQAVHFIYKSMMISIPISEQSFTTTQKISEQQLVNFASEVLMNLEQ